MSFRSLSPRLTELRAPECPFDDPYVAVRQTRLVDTESEPEEAPSEAEELQSLGSSVPLMGEEFEAVEPSGTRIVSSHSSASSNSTTPLSPDHPLTHISPTPTPIHSSFHRRTARMTVRVQPAMFPSHSARVTEAMDLSDSAFRKRYRSSYESPSSSSSPALPVQKRYRGTSELILDTDNEGDELGDEDIKKDEEDESLDADDEGERSDDEGHKGEGLGLEEEEEDEDAPEGQQQAVLVMDTVASEPLCLGYEAARRHALESIEEITPSTYEVGQSSRSMPKQQGAYRVSAFRQPTLTTWVDPEDDRVYTDIPVYPPVAPVQTLLSPEWSSGYFPISLSSPVVPSPIASLVATLKATISRLDALPPTLVADIDRDVRELYTRSGVVRDDIFSQRPVLALEGRVAALEQERGHREP
ncbi:hypothetical protein Tco_0543356 [Tanacetum coccineum]